MSTPEPVTPRDDLRDRIALEMCEERANGRGPCWRCTQNATRLLERMPGLVDASNAICEGWLQPYGRGGDYCLVFTDHHAGMQRVLVIAAQRTPRGVADPA